MAGLFTTGALALALTLTASSQNSSPEKLKDLLQSERLLGRFGSAPNCLEGPYLVLATEGVTGPEDKAAPAEAANEDAALLSLLALPPWKIVAAERKGAKQVRIFWRAFNAPDGELLSADLSLTASGFRIQKTRSDPGQVWYRC